MLFVFVVLFVCEVVWVLALGRADPVERLSEEWFLEFMCFFGTQKRIRTTTQTAGVEQQTRLRAHILQFTQI